MFPNFKPNRSSKSQPTIASEAVQALVNLGYKKREAETLIQETINHYDLGEKISSGEISVENLFSMAILPRAEVKPTDPPSEAEANLLPGGDTSESAASADIVSAAEPAAMDVEPEAIESIPNSPTSNQPEPQPELPPVPDGHARFWHGGAEYTGGSRWLSPDRSFAEDGYTDESRKLHYVDIPQDSPHLKKAFDDSGTDTRAPFVNFEAPEEIAKNLRPVESRPQPVNPPAPVVAPDDLRISNSPIEEPVRRETPARVIPSGWLGSDRQDNRTQPQPVEQPRPTAPTQTQPAPATDGASVSASIQNQFVTESQSPSTQQPAPVVDQSQPASQPAPPTESESMVDTGLDTVQTGLDAAGVVDPTPISDGANAVISLGRAVSDPKNAGSHLMNAGISVVSMIPYIGDLAKGLKYGGKAAKGARAGRAAGKATSRGESALLDGAANKTPTEQFEDIWNKVEQQRAGGMGGSVNNGLGGSGGSGGSGSGGEPPSGGDDDPDPSSPGSSEPVADANVKPMTDKALEVAGVFGTVVAAGLAYSKTTEQLNKVVLEYHRHISGFNGELAQAYGELETGRMQRDMQNAADYGGSVAGLAGSQNELEEALRDFQAPFTEMGTDIQNGLTQLATLAVQAIDFIEPLSELYPLIKEWLGFKGDDSAKAPGGYFDKLRQRANNIKQRDKV